jgi:ribosomal RNA small subunit methyltransferase RsmB
VANSVNTREIILGILMEVTEEEQYSHIALRNTLDKYQYLSKQDRAFITRVTEGTIEYMTQMDYIINQFASVKVANMKPLIRNLIRSAVYQMKYMEQVPNSAICNEAVKIAQKRGFYTLKGFVNGVLRAIGRGLEAVEFPREEESLVEHLVVKYSMPRWIVEKWLPQYGTAVTELILADFLQIKPTTVRVNLEKATIAQVTQNLIMQGIKVKETPYLSYGLYLSGYNYLKSIQAFRDGWFQVQDLSSMFVAEIAAPKWGDYVIDVCAAPGGKSLHIADKLRSSGYVEARDLTDNKVAMIKENIAQNNIINMNAVVKDATVYDSESVDKADIVIADVPCSGFGVIGKKADIKYKMTQKKQDDLVELQRKILDTIYKYVKVGGTLVYSTCTIGAAENQGNIKWFLENYPFKLESIDEYIPKELHSKTTDIGYMQLLPGVHSTDGFFIARLKRME